MSDPKDLTTKLEGVTGDEDFSDPNFYTNLLGYNAEPAEAPAPSEPEPQPQGETAPPEEPAPQSTPAPASAEPSEDQIAGALTKDGKHVIPYQVVQDLRTSNLKQAERIAELQAAMERMQAEQQAQANGTSSADSQAQAAAAALEFTEDELADIADMPHLGKLVKGYQALQQQLAEVKAAPPQPQQPDDRAAKAEAAQAVIDTMPMLARWQAKGGELWAEAVKRDAELRADPAWANKPMAERFAHVQSLVADEYGIAVASAPSVKPAAAQQPRPASPVAVRETTPTLTDFAGGPMAVGDPMAGMTVQQRVDKAMEMSVEDIRRRVGLSY